MKNTEGNFKGVRDIIIEPSGAQMLYDKVSSTDKTIKIYDEMYHEVFNEPGREHVLKDVEVWLEVRLNSTTVT